MISNQSVDEIEKNLPKTCKSRDGTRTGNGVGWRHCRLDGCGGHCIIVRWPDGKRTEPCLKGCKFVSKNVVQIL